MRKSILTKALMLVALVVCLVCALGVTAFAENTSKELVSATGDVTITTEYGELVIPAEYADANAYPFVIFDGDNQFLAATPKLNGESASTHAFQYAKENLAAGKTMLIYMRRDYTTGAEYCTQMGAQKKTSTLILDLGGNTLTLGNYLWWSYSLGDDNTYVTQITKNGTINSGNYWMYSGGSYWKNKEYFVRFENVTFDNIKSQLVITPVELQANATQITNYYITFEGCTFNVASSFSSSVIYLSDTKSSNGDRCRGYITVNGGTFNGNGSALLFSVRDSNINKFPNNSIDFGPDEDGNYTVFNNAANAISNITPVTPDKYPLATRNLSNTSFTLVPFSFASTYLNLSNSLNFVYRVCLPEGYSNPVANFIVGGDSTTVTEYELDENGLYCFTLTAIAPHKMGDLVNATVTASYNGEEVSITNDKVSVKNYADSLRTLYAQDEEMIALLDALLVYGAAAQTYMEYDLENLVAEVGELSAIPEAPITLAGESSAIANIVAYGLMLDGAFDLRVGIEATEVEGLTLDITKGGVTTTVTLSEDMMKHGYLTVYYDGLTIAELDTEVTFTLKHNGAAVGKTLAFSANTYLYKTQTSENTALATLAKALYAYGVAANAFAN